MGIILSDIGYTLVKLSHLQPLRFIAMTASCFSGQYTLLALKLLHG